jgi:metal-dependent amidase/aminoacylase/carboxypeptidase family protein
VLEQVPGTFTMVGACPAGNDPSKAPYNHSAEAVFDDAIITDGMTLYAELAVRRLVAAAAEN